MNTGVRKGIALVIGNADYQEQERLPACANDAQNIEKALQSLLFDVKKILNGTREEMLKGVSAFLTEADSYSVVLVYYSGHGAQIDGVNYLVPTDFIYDRTKSISVSRLININVLTEYMNSHAGKTNILILDACRTTVPFARDFFGTGLAEVNAGRGTIVAFATSPNTAAICDDQGFYTRCLLKHIAEPNEKIEDMFKKVREDVVMKSGGKQIPWESTSLQNDFYFNTMTVDQIHESIYQLMRNNFRAETLILLSTLYGFSVSDVFRIYERQKAEKPGGIQIEVKTSFEQYILEGILGLGFSFINYRWTYKGRAVKMGEFFHDYKQEIAPRTFV